MFRRTPKGHREEGGGELVRKALLQGDRVILSQGLSPEVRKESLLGGFTWMSFLCV